MIAPNETAGECEVAMFPHEGKSRGKNTERPAARSQWRGRLVELSIAGSVLAFFVGLGSYMIHDIREVEASITALSAVPRGLHAVAGNPIEVETLQTRTLVRAAVEDGSGGRTLVVIDVPPHSFSVVSDAKLGVPRISGALSSGRSAKSFDDVPPFTSPGEAIRAENVVVHVDGTTPVTISGK